MHWWSWLVLGVLLVVAFVLGGLVYRVREVRSAGTPVIFRALPAGIDRGWRHGSVHYTERALVYYRLSSLRPGPTAVLSRRHLELIGRRAPEGTERQIMDSNMVVLALRDSGPGARSGDYEMAMDQILVTAFLSWLEARAPRRSRRSGPAA